MEPFIKCFWQPMKRLPDRYFRYDCPPYLGRYSRLTNRICLKRIQALFSLNPTPTHIGGEGLRHARPFIISYKGPNSSELGGNYNRTFLNSSASITEFIKLGSTVHPARHHSGKFIIKHIPATSAIVTRDCKEELCETASQEKTVAPIALNVMTI